MNYAVDEIVDKKAKLESLDTQEIKIVPTVELPDNIHEGSILTKIDDSYEINYELEYKRRRSIRSRLNTLKKNNG